MTALASIVVATDFSRDAENALRRAALLAQQHSARLGLLHVVDPSARRGPRAWFSSKAGLDRRVDLAEANLGRLAAQVESRHGVPATPSVRVGGALEQICAQAEEADLLVLGSRRVNPLRNLVLGTPAEQVLRVVRRPVLVAKRPAPERYERVLVALDVDGDFRSVLRHAGTLAEGASLHVFHALGSRRTERMRAGDVPADLVRKVAASERHRALARLHSRLAALGLADARASVEHGDPRQLVLERQRAIGADLVVIGQGGPSPLCRFLLGDVPQQVLSNAPCDVLVLPRPAARGQTVTTRLPIGSTST